ncbi:MAG: sensor histidine kinase [Clostridiaceae bacterium]
MNIEKTNKFVKVNLKNVIGRRLPTGKITLRHKITIAVILAVLLPMSLAGIYFYTSLSSILINNEYSSLEQLIKQTDDNIAASLDMVDVTYMHLLTSPTLRPSIFDVNGEMDEYSFLRKKLDIESELKYNMLFDNAWKNQLIKTLYLFLNENTYCSMSRSMSNIQVVNENNIKIYKNTFGDTHSGKMILPPSYTDQTIYYASNIYNIYTNKILCKLIIGIDENTLSRKYSHILEYKGAMGYIFDNEGIIYSHPDKSMLGKKVDSEILELKKYRNTGEVTLGNQEYYITSREVEDSGLIFLIGIPKSQVFSKLSESIKNYLFITLLIAVVSLTLSIYLSLHVSKFIKSLLDSLNKVKSGDYGIKLPPYKNPELNLLSDTFNKMTDEVSYLIDQVYKKQLLLKETEFKFLQSQMNPHFLFNTLATIGYKARLGQYDSIHGMVTSLSELLQASIYTGRESKITIRQELEYIKFYLYLQKTRFEDNLEYNIHIDDESILDYYLPKLCVEPIVENAVVHGLENKVGAGTVNVNVSADAESVYIEVIDDGMGFDPESVDINSTDHTGSNKIHCRIGLSNTNKRIKLLYGEQYGIYIKSETSKGSKVMIHIPIDKGDDCYV